MPEFYTIIAGKIFSGILGRGHMPILPPVSYAYNPSQPHYIGRRHGNTQSALSVIAASQHCTVKKKTFP